MSGRDHVLSHGGRGSRRLADRWLHVWGLGLVASLLVPVVVAKMWPAWPAWPGFTRCDWRADHLIKAKTDVSLLTGVLDEFDEDVGRYPLVSEGLGALVARPADVAGDKWGGPYVKELPEDPWGRAYRYFAPGSDGEAHVVSAGPDGVLGTADDIGG